MAPKSEDKLNTGGELVKNGFKDCNDKIKNVIQLLEVAGLSYILEKPCRVLDREVLELFKNAKLSRKGPVIRSKVRGKTVRISSTSLNSAFKLSISEEEDDEFTEEDVETALRWCGFHGRKYGSIKKNAFNDEGKLLTDIVGKVLICKHGSHDHISKNMFKLMGYIILSKRINWGKVLFEKIKESLKIPSFGRILSLYLCNVYGETFNEKVGTSLHHSKKIDYKIFHRWERVIRNSATCEKGESSRRKEPTVDAAEDEAISAGAQEVEVQMEEIECAHSQGASRMEVEVEDSVPPAPSEASADEILVADVEGEICLAQDVRDQIDTSVEQVVEQLTVTVDETEIVDSTAYGDPLNKLNNILDRVIAASERETHPECSTQKDLLNFLDSDDLELSADEVIELVEEEAHLETSIQKDQGGSLFIEENLYRDIATFDSSGTKEMIPTIHIADTPVDVFSDTILEENLAREEISDTRQTCSSVPATQYEDELLGHIGKMMEEQRKFFEKSLEKVSREIKAELKEVKDIVGLINSQIIGWGHRHPEGLSAGQ